jgi:hypothetical protein
MTELDDRVSSMSRVCGAGTASKGKFNSPLMGGHES